MHKDFKGHRDHKVPSQPQVLKGLKELLVARVQLVLKVVLDLQTEDSKKI